MKKIKTYPWFEKEPIMTTIHPEFLALRKEWIVGYLFLVQMAIAVT
jgi:hypothetical protein